MSYLGAQASACVPRRGRLVYKAERQFAAGVYAPEAAARQRRVGSRTPEEWSAGAVIASVIVAVISAIAAVIALFITRGQMEETWRTRYVDALKPGRLPLPLEVRHSTKQTLEGWMQEDSRTFPGPAFMTMSTGPGASTLRFLGVVSRLDPGIPINPRCPESDVDYRALTVEVTSSAGSP